MKKFSMLAVAALVSLGLASCAKDDVKTGLGTDVLALRINTPASRVVETAGASGQIQVNSGFVYIADASGTIIHEAALNYADATSTTGQLITGIPSNSSSVYIIANVSKPSDTDAATLTSLKSVSLPITGQTNYKSVALANNGGTEATIAAPASDGLPATVSLTIAPLISRVELSGVLGKDNAGELASDGTTTITSAHAEYVKITGFRVKGVFLTSYYKEFTLSGASSGSQENVTSGATSFETGDLANISATNNGSGDFVARPAGVWAQNVVAKGLPRFIIKISDVTATGVGGSAVTNIVNKAGEELTLSGAEFYLTMSSTNPYSGAQAPSTDFARGKIYQIAELEFNSSHLFTLPAEESLDLKVNVTLQDWSPAPVTGNL